MADETVVTGTVPASTDTAQAVPLAEKAAPTGETPDAEKAPEQPKEKPADPQKSELAYLKRKLARQEREQQALIERLITAQQPRTEPNREAAPKISDFDDIDKFLDARDQWKTRQTEPRTKAEGPPQAYQNAVNEARSDLMTAGTEKYENFEELVSSDDNKITVPMRDAIFDIEDLDTQVDVTWFLANNPKEQIRISRLSPARQIKEIDRLEAKLKSQPTKKVSAAPDPIEPVGGAKTSSDELRPEMKFEDFIKIRNKQLGRK